MSKTIHDWLSYLYQIHSSRIDLGLQRISSIAKDQGLVSFDCPVVIVGGTNGKGSCIKLLESIYRAAGYGVGAYYSPHIERFNERIYLNGLMIEDDALISVFEKVERFRRDCALSFFEFTTLAALVYFQEKPLDVLLLEVGLGGRLDAVNVVEPDVSVVTTIGIDHVDWLGDDREKIGFEKAGTFRANKPAICGDLDPPRSLIDFAHQVGSKFFMLNKGFSYQVHADSWDWKSGESHYEHLPLPSLKCQNAATSLMVIECLKADLPLEKKDLIKGLKNARLSGRFQEFYYPVKGILDVAHNPDSAAWLAQQLGLRHKAAYNIAVFSMLEDKDIAQTITHLLPHIKAWYVGNLSDDRASDSAEIVAYLRTLGVKNCYNFATVAEAMRKAIQACALHKDARVIVFGSFHTVAAAQQVLDNWSD